MTYQDYLTVLMDELENKCQLNDRNSSDLSSKKSSKEINILIDKSVELLRLINNVKVDANAQVNPNKLKFKITHKLNPPVSANVSKSYQKERGRHRSLKPTSLQKVAV